MRIKTESSILRMKKGSALFIGSVMDTDFHRHHAIQLVLSGRGPFSLFCREREYQSPLIIVNSNIEHRLVGGEGIQALLLIEPETVYGKLISGRMATREILLIEDEALVRNLAGTIFSRKTTIDMFLDELIGFWSIRMTPRAIDGRIVKIIRLIEQSEGKKIPVRELADHVFLSESRLQHIFKDQIGISIKRYLLWKRMIDGINSVVKGGDLTSASYESGFSDSSHMSRTFKEMFGINLSDIFKNSRSLQVIVEDC